jgi:FkbM family methyltransferase
MMMNNLLTNNSLLLIDVGASGGIHSRWPKFTSCYKAVLFEPDPREAKILKSKNKENITVIESALSDSEKTIDFHLCKKQQNSSMYLPNFEFINKFPDSERFEVLRSIKMEADSLDSQLKKNNIEDTDFIKLDTQGSELSILQGGVNTLKNVIGVEIEVEFVELYKKQPLFNEIDTFMKKNGFQLYDLRRYFWRTNEEDNYYGNMKGQLVIGEALYFRPPEQVISVKGFAKEKIIRAIFIYLVYGYPGLSKELLNAGSKTKLLPIETCDKILSIILSYRKSGFKLIDFKGKGRVLRMAHKIANIFAPNNNWYCGTDESIGN